MAKPGEAGWGGAWVATYRVQLQPEFTFAAAAEIADYLAALGVSHLYCSPYLQAAPASTHGYDVVDHSCLNQELGGEEGFRHLVGALDDAGLGQVADVVPNHMAIAGRANRWWWDVLENGPASRYASYFDINWDQETRLGGKVLVPILGDHYGRVLDAGELVVDRVEGSFVVRYHDHELPLSPMTLSQLNDGGTEGSGTDGSGAEGNGVERELAAINSDVDRLDALLERQNYRLAYWKVASRELGYRRFFDITGLVGLRVESQEVFDETHALIVDLVARGDVDGLRVDHPDGLRDPQEYLERLSGAVGGAPVLVEKILAPDETVPSSWPVVGTTGYDFLNIVSGVFVDPAGEEALSDFYSRFTGEPIEVAALAHDAKILVMGSVLASDVERLTTVLVEVCESTRHFRDFTRWELREAIVEAIAAFDVYRSYVRPGIANRADDEARATAALARAVERRPDLDPELFEFLADVLLLRRDGPNEREVSARFQQVCAAVMAKGIEDTAMYRFNRLVALNEVGAELGAFATPVEKFHRWMTEAAQRRPGSLLATSTHDTKRGEDFRARLRLLAEVPDLWKAEVSAWTAMAEPYRGGEGTARAYSGRLPDGNTEYLFFQTLVGAWPLEVARAWPYIEKAVRESKLHTSWTDPDDAYEDSVRAFVEGVMGDEAIMARVGAFVDELKEPGWVSSLAQTLVKLTAPGVPDIYQGSELWDLNLVDPDNRRPVDYAGRRRLLTRVTEGTAADAWTDAPSGAPKMFVIQRALAARRRLAPTLDGASSYTPLVARGEAASHVLGFLRGGHVAVIVPRLVMALERAGGWGDTVVDLPGGGWTDEFTGHVRVGGQVKVGELLGEFPVAMLARS